MIGAAFGIYAVKIFGRRSILLIGHATLCFLLIGIGFATLYNKGTIQLIFVLVFIVIYSATSGAVASMYTAEICSDAALSAVWFTFYFWTTIIT